MEGSVGYRALNNLSQEILNFIDCSISSYFSVINSPERLDMIKRAIRLASVIGNI